MIHIDIIQKTNPEGAILNAEILIRREEEGNSGALKFSLSEWYNTKTEIDNLLTAPRNT